MLSLKDIVDLCKAQAIANAFSADESAMWRWFCRSYSKAFHTPLAQVLEMDPEHVVLHFYEDKFDQTDVEEELESLLDQLDELENPDYDRNKQKELKDFIKKAEAEERARVAAGKPIHPAMLKDRGGLQLAPEMPTSGSINLSYLEQEEMQDEES